MVLAIIPYLQDRSIGDRIKPFDAVASAVPDGWTTRIETFLSFFLTFFLSFFLWLSGCLSLFQKKKNETKNDNKKCHSVTIRFDHEAPLEIEIVSGRSATKKKNQKKTNKTKQKRNGEIGTPHGREGAAFRIVRGVEERNPFAFWLNSIDRRRLMSVAIVGSHAHAVLPSPILVLSLEPPYYHNVFNHEWIHIIVIVGNRSGIPSLLYTHQRRLNMMASSLPLSLGQLEITRAFLFETRWNPVVH